MKEKVLAAMSGGVDSSVAAALLRDEGYDVTGVTLRLYDNEDIGITDHAKTCCSLRDVRFAREVCNTLGIPHYVLNYRDSFCENVIDRFVEGYMDGLTPNPCIDCNRYIKFDALLRRALLLEHDHIATGHYAKIEFDGASGRFLLKRPADKHKDQTYVLYGMTQNQLSKTLFPLGGLTKDRVREIAGDLSFINAEKADSQDICFVPDDDYASFIAGYTGRSPEKGDFVDTEGVPIGEHGGIARYTIGQRKGLGKSFGKPMFVVSKNARNNTVTLGAEGDLYAKGLVAGDVNLIALETLKVPLDVTAKIRYKMREAKATLHPLDEGKVYIEFEVPQRAITPGQAVVFYSGDVVIGGGTIAAE